MGLDQFLYARRTIDDEARRAAIVKTVSHLKRYDDTDSHYLSRSEAKRSTTDAVLALAGLTPMLGVESDSGQVAYDGSWVSVLAVYWRKANAVHAWFVDECQGGIDECQEAVVHAEQLVALAATCEAAVTAYRSGDLAKASELMQPRSGFFFGSTELNEYWVEDMAHTAREIRRVVDAAIAIGGVEFVYQSSW